MEAGGAGESLLQVVIPVGSSARQATDARSNTGPAAERPR